MIFEKHSERAANRKKEDYKWEIDFYHGENAKELLGYQMQCLGNRPDSAAFIYNAAELSADDA